MLAANNNDNNNDKTPEDHLSPEVFFLSNDVVPEDAWEEIRSYLGLSTSPLVRGETSGSNADSSDPFLTIDGFGGNNGGEDNQQKGGESDASRKIPWESTPFPQNRPVAQFGFRYDYDKDVVVPPPTDEATVNAGEKRVPKIPDVFERLLLRPYQDLNCSSNSKRTEFTQCIVNVYRPSTTVTTSDGETTTTSCSSIPWHVDDPQFGPEILVFTFGETRPLHMRLEQHDNNSIDNNAASSDKTKDTNTDEDDSGKKYSYFTAHPSHRSCYVLSGPARHNWQHSVPSGNGWRVSITFRTLRTQN